MPVLLALHDAEGDENDLPPVLRFLAPGWAILSPKLTGEAADLVRWIETKSPAVPYAFAYGSGADLAAELLLRHAGVLAGGILLRPSLKPTEPAAAHLRAAPVLIVTGGEGEGLELARILSEAGARVDLAAQNCGRELTPQDFSLAKQWLLNQL